MITITALPMDIYAADFSMAIMTRIAVTWNSHRINPIALKMTLFSVQD
jgi:hypothetical protein